MSANAYVFINVEPENIQEVVERLNTIPGGIVREVVGPYDVVVELEADTEEDLAGILRHKINPVPGVTNSVTCTWFAKDVTGLSEGHTGSE
jgi:DNA-binding Lrp family transcriptional regulator